MPGAARVTVSVNVALALPVAFVAVIVYADAACTVVGAPVNKPVEVLNESPAGSAGLIAYLAIVPPVEVIV